MGRASRSEEDVDQVLAMIERYDSIGYAQEFAAGVAEVAAESFEPAFGRVPANRDTEFLRDMIGYMVAREF